MPANKSGICKVPNCNKLQVRDGFCKQCGEYYLQKSILMKLTNVSEELANMKPSNATVITQSNDNTLLVEIMSKQTDLLQGVVTGIKELKETLDEQQPTKVVERVIEQSAVQTNVRPSAVEADDVFVPSTDSIDVNGDVQIVEDKKEQQTSKDLASIADKLNAFNA